MLYVQMPANPPQSGKHQVWVTKCGKHDKTIRGRTVGGRQMAGNESASEAAHASVKLLVAEKLRYLVPMTAIFMVGYIGLTVLAGFAPDLVGRKVAGSLNLGFVLIGFNYLLSWALAIVYGRVAADKFDPLAAKAAAEIRQAGKSP
jgi:uncharacterized membrane protein (DUF485 family)